MNEIEKKAMNDCCDRLPKEHYGDRADAWRSCSKFKENESAARILGLESALLVEQAISHDLLKTIESRTHSIGELEKCNIERFHQISKLDE